MQRTALPRGALAATAAFAALAPPLLPGTIRVPSDEPTLEAAIARAAPGDTVLAAAGEYVVTEPLSFRGKDFVLRSEDGAASAAIRMGDPADPDRSSVILFDGGETEGAVLEGFTVTGGRGSRWGSGAEESGGGGVLSRNGSRPVVKSCVITGNSARNGGGVMCDAGASITIEGCEISRNAAGGIGGGILWLSPAGTPALRSSRLLQNWAASGGALFCYEGASPEITGCRIEGNMADSVAGGLCCLIDSRPSVEATVFAGNSASGAGAISCETATDSPRLENCLVFGNLAFTGGGVQARGGASPRFINCTITANAALGEDGGIACPGGTPVFVNSIVAGNEPASVCGDVTSSITDGDPLFALEGDFDFERFQAVDAGGRTIQMPDFILEPGDYHLAPGSPGIDAGTADGAPGADLDGNARPCGAGVDVGAYERCVEAPPAFLRGNANDDAKVDISDAVFALDYLFLGSAAPGCLKALDFDDSGRVNISDAVYLLGFLFLGGSAPPQPSACGPDPTEDDLTCESFTQCAG